MKEILTNFLSYSFCFVHLQCGHKKSDKKGQEKIMEKGNANKPFHVLIIAFAWEIFLPTPPLFSSSELVKLNGKEGSEMIFNFSAFGSTKRVGERIQASFHSFKLVQTALSPSPDWSQSEVIFDFLFSTPGFL